MKIPELILANLTEQVNTQLQNKDSEYIAQWCYSQHFANDYRGIYLIVVALFCISVYGIVKIYIKDFEFKFIKMTINKEFVLTELIFWANWSLIIFTFLWLYLANDYHFLDKILHFLNVI